MMGGVLEREGFAVEMPDFSEWKQHQLWTLVEAACLLCGIEPMPAMEFNKDRKTGGVPAKIYADLKDAFELKQLKFFPSRDRYIHGRRVMPDECVTWAVGRGYSIPAELQDLKKRDSNETAQQRRDRLKRRVAEEKSKGNRAFNKTVAEEEGFASTARLKQILGAEKKKSLTKTSNASWAASLTPPSGKSTPSPKRGSKD